MSFVGQQSCASGISNRLSNFPHLCYAFKSVTNAPKSDLAEFLVQMIHSRMFSDEIKLRQEFSGSPEMHAISSEYDLSWYQDVLSS